VGNVDAFDAFGEAEQLQFFLQLEKSLFSCLFLLARLDELGGSILLGKGKELAFFSLLDVEDFSELLRKSQGHEDLFYRLNIMPIYVPPLRERKEDIPYLLNMFVNQFNKEFRKKVGGFSEEAERLLISYHWPGNIRELRNVVERAVILAEDSTINPNLLPPEIVSADQKRIVSGIQAQFPVVQESGSLDAVEKELIIKALNEAKGNKGLAAKSLGISRTTLWKKLKGYGIEKLFTS
jgi:DNA-binding NtrC family response regulator